MNSTPGPSGTGTRPGPAVALGLVILCIEGYDLFILGAVGPALLAHPDWDVTKSTLGFLGSLTALGMPLGSIVAGWAGDLYGRRLPMAVSLAWLSGAMLLSAVADDLTLFAATRFVTGVGIGALIPLVTAYVSDAATPSRHSLQVGTATTGLAIGGIITGVVARTLLPEWDFHTLFLFGVLPLVLIPVVWRMVPAVVRDEPGADAPPAGAGPADRQEPADSTNRLATLLSPRYRTATLLFWAATFSGLVIVYGASTWLPTLMVDSGYDLGSSLEFSIAFNIGAVVGTLGAALIADRGFLKAATMVSFLLAAVAMITLSTPQPRPVLLLASAVAGCGALGTQGLVNIFVAHAHPARLRGTALGFSLGVGRVGAIVGPSYVAAATAISWSKAGFFAFVVPALLGAVLIGLLRVAWSPSQAAGGDAAPEETPLAR
ncbi:MFS transporter [Streptomyces sp. 3MP-14]|uniref:MFS transporter n=1 Tax=Streptomyces mimosae TaxID=2586635 RepID=A0A5N5ZWM7_9ACTN|nr:MULTISPECIES: MFS transporter [Streptomyces]KAB8159448.1 MFS transporter [Streptomyces mimosae]KAB8172664.1 MFS transporter [Streptomyces sp. 3MP-14]